MKAPSAGYVLHPSAVGWAVVDTVPTPDWPDGHVVWCGRTLKGARTAHWRLSIWRITGKDPGYAAARRAGNA